MSSLKSLSLENFSSNVKHPWDHIFKNIATLTENDILYVVSCESNTDISWFIDEHQNTLEDLASNLPMSNLFYAMYGIVLTCTTGKLHSYLSTYCQSDWVIDLFHLNFHGNPIFVYACQKNFEALIIWMVEIMNDLKDYSPLHQLDENGDSPLHLAVRYKKWDWALRLIEHGCSPSIKNNAGKTPIMLAAPHTERVCVLFTRASIEWYNALHEALVDGREHAMWCFKLIEMGADVNQPELYDSPVDTLVILAQSGMDMNLGSTVKLSAEQNRILFLNGKVPDDWSQVLDSFEENEWIRMFFNLHCDRTTQVPEEYKQNVLNCRAVTTRSVDLQYKVCDK